MSLVQQSSDFTRSRRSTSTNPDPPAQGLWRQLVAQQQRLKLIRGCWGLSISMQRTSSHKGWDSLAVAMAVAAAVGLGFGPDNAAAVATASAWAATVGFTFAWVKAVAVACR